MLFVWLYWLYFIIFIYVFCKSFLRDNIEIIGAIRLSEYLTKELKTK